MSEMLELANGLNENQRAAIIKIGDPNRPFGGMWRTGLHSNDEFDLKDRHIVSWQFPDGTQAPMCSLTPKGIKIRNHLLASLSEDKGS